MKKIIAALLLLFLLFADVCNAEELIFKENSRVVAGTDIDAGTYTISDVKDDDYSTFAILDTDKSVLDSFTLGLFEDSTIVTLEEGQMIMLMIGSISLAPLSEEQSKAVMASDPYLNAIDGVDLHQAFAKAEDIAEASGDYPLLKSVGFNYDEKLNTISITIWLLDDATVDIAHTYAYDMVRMVNTCCIYQNTSIAPSAPKYLGGIYDVVNCTLLACRWNDMPDITKALVNHIIPVGTQGFGTVDANELK